MTPAYLRPGLFAPLWRAILRLLGWRIQLNLPAESKYVVVVAPHTSNWDFIIGILSAWAIGLPNPRWVGKDSLFRPPLGWIMYRIGGVPVDRRRSQNFVEQVAGRFADEEVFLLALAPEGTRRRTDYWRTGFYYIAQAAGVPIVLAYLDFANKVAGTGPVLHPTGDIHADFVTIRAFYSTIQGRHPELQGEIRPRMNPAPPAPDAEAQATDDQ
ncbi:MAG: lysophospholipid acyltransferase family protein [Litorilinea sp.]